MMAEPSPRPDYNSDNFGQQAYATKPRWGAGASSAFAFGIGFWGTGAVREAYPTCILNVRQSQSFLGLWGHVANEEAPHGGERGF